jgi:hypothetical protein
MVKFVEIIVKPAAAVIAILSLHSVSVRLMHEFLKVGL